MEFSLTRGTFDNRAVGVSKEDYELASKGRSALMDIAMAESKYDLAVENYLELEKTVLSSTLEHMIFHQWDFASRARRHLDLIDRRMFNFLSSATAYLEVGERCAQRISRAGKQFRQQVMTFRTSELAFRLMEELRDIANHSGKAIHQVNFGSSLRDQSNGNTGFEFNIEFAVFVHDLEKNRRGFKYISKDDIQKLSDKADLKPMLRLYMEALSYVQDALRNLCLADIENAENLMKSLLKRFNETFPNHEPVNGLYLSEANASDLSLPILSFDETLKYYREKNRVLTNLRRRFVTNEIAFGN